MRHQPKGKPLPKFLRETIYSTTYCSTLLDVLSNPQHSQYERVVDVISPLIEKGAKNETAREAWQRFNRWFQGQPETWGDKPWSGGLEDYVPGAWDPDGDDLEIVPSDDISPSTYASLKAFLESRPSRRRLKRCLECQAYFFDRTKRNNAVYHTPACANRAGVRRFRAARHPK